ncbi:hypothetical protein [Nocardia sp. NPDC005978]|uniref:hypothetical protein n=1 Tax=unclassified Nocardia TaxID=2637762 RepID=UPI0033BDE806
MDIDRSTVPGRGVLHHCVTRGGDRFAVLAETDGDRHLLVYDPRYEEPAHAIALEVDEADQVADLLHSFSLPDRLARLEQRLDLLTQRRSRP